MNSSHRLASPERLAGVLLLLALAPAGHAEDALLAVDGLARGAGLRGGRRRGAVLLEHERGGGALPLAAETPAGG